MRYVTRIHLSDCGWHEAYYPGTTIDLRDPRTGVPGHTVFSLENTGGKTSFLSLVLSCFDTHEKRFLKTLIRSNQRFGDYFGDVPAFILVEWDLSGGQESFLEPGRLVTGQVVVKRGDGRQREIDRRFFTFRSTPGLTFDRIPAPGLEGFRDYGRLNGYRDVQRWLHEMRSGHPGNFQDFDRHKDWKRKLAEERIDTALLAAQVDFNRSEGDTEHMPIDKVTVSGGELLTAAMMIYLVLARLRAESMHRGAGEAGILIMDNPLGKANKALLLKTQIGLADAMAIQLFYTTGVQDTSALAEFENIVRLRRNSQSRGTRRIHVEVEAMHAHMDKRTSGESARDGTAAEAAD